MSLMAFPAAASVRGWRWGWGVGCWWEGGGGEGGRGNGGRGGRGKVVATVHVGLTESDSNGRTTDGLNVKAVRGSYGGGEIRRDRISQCETMSFITWITSGFSQVSTRIMQRDELD